MPTRGYLVSKYPPDAPVRPSAEFESLEEAERFAASKRSELMWFPPEIKKAKHAHQS